MWQVFRPSWKRTMRTADTLHAWDFAFSRCFRSAILYEMTRDFKVDRELKRILPTPKLSTPTLTNLSDASLTAASGSESAASPPRRHRSQPTVNTTKPLSEGAIHKKLLDAFPRNHWLHRMKEHLSQQLRVNLHSEQWLANGTELPTLGYLLPDGGFSSNPCGASCLLNPVYDFLPRGAWVVSSGICQRPSDFIYDPVSQSLCCPSPDYCCPNSKANCSDTENGAAPIFFDLQTANGGRPVPLKQLTTTAEDGWRRHFHAVERQQGVSSLCSARRGEWNGGAGHPACFWAMGDESIEALREVWTRAEHDKALRLPLAHDDDDTHQWGKSGVH